MNAFLKRCGRFCAVFTAFLCSASLCGAMHSDAAARRFLLGDLDADGDVDSTDAALLLPLLTTEQPLTSEVTARRADINEDGIVNAADLTLLKRIILKPDPKPDASEIPVSVLTPTLPASGEPRVLMILVNFPDCVHSDKVTAEDVQKRCFGPEDPESVYYPMESISAYYARASYGSLHLTGDVYTYTAQNNVKLYAGNRMKLLLETMTGLDDEIDYTRYDSNQDGFIDSVILALPGSAGKTDWRAMTGKYVGNELYDGCRIGARTIGSSDVMSQAVFNSVWTHELGHAMGLPDYYKYVNTGDGTFGLNGEAGWELMDDAYGDLSAFSKLMLGWCTEPAVQIYTGGTQTFEIPCGQTAPGCVIIPRRDPDDRLNEYFVLEYVTNTGNNQAHFQQIRPISLFTEGGLRVTHAESTVSIGLLDIPEFKWNNYGKNYDKSNEKQRVLRLVNEAEGGSFFRPGDVLTDSLSGFRWYDENGDQTVPAGCTVTVKSIENDICTVEIAEAAT